MPRDRKRPEGMAVRTGFTLIELLVVMATIGVLIALLLPAVHTAREAAWRTRCTNNLKQVGLAMHQYVDAVQVLPPGYVSTWVLRSEYGPGWGWGSMLLPGLEQRGTFDSINFLVPIEDDSNDTIRSQRISAYLCPSDTPEPFFWAVGTPEKVVLAPTSLILGKKVGGGPVFGGKICQVASANYVAMFGLGEPGVDGDGLFYRNSSTSFAQITDGLSQTIAAGERGHDLGYATWIGSVTGATLFNPEGSPVGRIRPEPGAGMTLGHAGEGVGPGDVRSDVNMFYSRHSGGVNFVFADGHVTFLKTTTAPSVFAAMATRAGHEVIPSP